jgi:O-antigen ligase
MQLINSFRLLNPTKINILLIVFLPISLFVGSLILNLNIVLIILFFLMDCKKRNNFLLFKENSFIFLIIIWLYLIFNSIYVGDTSESIIRASGFIRFILLGYAIFYYLNIKDKIYENTILKYWVYIFLIVSVDLAFEWLFGKNALGHTTCGKDAWLNQILTWFFCNQSNYPARLASFTGDELKIGGYYFGFVSLVLAYIFNKSKRFFIISFITFFVLSLLIGERANFIKVFLIYLMFVFFIVEISNFKKIITSIFFFIITVLIILNIQGLKSKFYNHTLSLNTLDKKITIKKLEPEQLLKNLHFSHYYTAINIFKENPIFGIGMKEFRIESTKKKYSPIKGAYGLGMHPHQIHFEILSELGIIGYMLIISNLFYTIINALKNNKNNSIFVKTAIMFIGVSFIPLIPSGSFFTTYGATIYWINYSLLIATLIKKENLEKIFLSK